MANISNNLVQGKPRRSDAEVLQMLAEYRQTGEGQIRDAIVVQFTNLVESIARRFSGSAESAEDLAQEGYIGLITAIDLYNPGKNVKFSTYATHFVIGQIKHCLRDRGKIIKEPAWLQELNQRVTRVIDSLVQRLSRAPSNAEIGEMMGISEEAVDELLTTREVFKVTSIDGGSSDDGDNGGAIDMDRQSSMDVSVSFQLPLEDKVVLETAMARLKELEQQVLSLFYFRELNQTEIARQLGISCNYVSHILRNSTKKLKKILVTDEVRDGQIRPNLRRPDAEPAPVDDGSGRVDQLTRLYGRAYFERRLDEEVMRIGRAGDELAVIFIRISGMEQYVHACGTIKGDEAILGVVQKLRASVRRGDIITRYAPDMFSLILPYTGDCVEVVGKRIAAALQDLTQEKHLTEMSHPVTVGIGYAVYPRDSSRGQGLIECASGKIKLSDMPEETRRAA